MSSVNGELGILRSFLIRYYILVESCFRVPDLPELAFGNPSAPHD